MRGGSADENTFDLPLGLLFGVAPSHYRDTLEVSNIFNHHSSDNLTSRHQQFLLGLPTSDLFLLIHNQQDRHQLEHQQQFHLNNHYYLQVHWVDDKLVDDKLVHGGIHMPL